jgi:hypothetical protein
VDGAQQAEHAGEAGHSDDELQHALPGKKKEHLVDGAQQAEHAGEAGYSDE